MRSRAGDGDSDSDVDDSLSSLVSSKRTPPLDIVLLRDRRKDGAKL